MSGRAGVGALSVAAGLPSAFPDIVTFGAGCSGAEELLASALHAPHCLMTAVTVSANDAAIAACNRLTNSSFSSFKSRRVASSAA